MLRIVDITQMLDGRTPESFEFVPEGQDDLQAAFRVDFTDDSVGVYVATIEMDADGDGIADARDNCGAVANPAQRDTDGDLYGNACDADLNNDGVVNVVDLGILRQVFFTNDADADFNGDGTVNVVDLGVMRAGFFLPPGPSGLVD